MDPILSIVIPTYNRGTYLKEALEKIAQDDAFAGSDDVEVLVSDNCSTDCTEEVCREFAKRFPDKFVYVRQDHNIGPSANFTYVLTHGRGKFIKMQNDNFIITDGLYGRIRDFVREHENEHPVIFFGSDCVMHKKLGEYRCTTYDEFLDAVSFWTTWIGGYGVWKDELDVIVPIQDKYADSYLQQVAVVWYLFEKNKVGYFCNWKQYEEENAVYGNKPRGTITAKIWVCNYFNILREFKGQGKISDHAWEVEKKRLYKLLFFNMYFDFNHKREGKYGKFFYYTKEYRKNFYYWVSLLEVPVFYLVGMLPKKLVQRLVDAYHVIQRKTA